MSFPGAPQAAYFECSDVLEKLDVRAQASGWPDTPQWLLVRAVMAAGYGLLAVADELERFNRSREVN